MRNKANIITFFCSDVQKIAYQTVFYSVRFHKVFIFADVLNILK